MYVLYVEIVVLSQSDCYHGDTLGTMTLTSPSFYNQSQHPWYESRCIEIFVPRVLFKNGVLRIDTTSLNINDDEVCMYF
jgi:adenosylmethionine-8-amino-7-oxononanoate aminotransferase